jgi:hypothetical protein
MSKNPVGKGSISNVRIITVILALSLHLCRDNDLAEALIVGYGTSYRRLLKGVNTDARISTPKIKGPFFSF